MTVDSPIRARVLKPFHRVSHSERGQRIATGWIALPSDLTELGTIYHLRQQVRATLYDDFERLGHERVDVQVDSRVSTTPGDAWEAVVKTSEGRFLVRCRVSAIRRRAAYAAFRLGASEDPAGGDSGHPSL